MLSSTFWHVLGENILLVALGQTIAFCDLVCSFFFQGIGNLNLSYLNTKLQILTINYYVQVFTGFS